MFEPDSSSQIQPQSDRSSQVSSLYSGQMEASSIKTDESNANISAILIEDVNQSTGDTTLSSTTETNMNIRNKVQKVCRVCGDKAKSFHFGGLSCDSCKAFFRRSVHNSAYESFQCTGSTPGVPCQISLNSRKSCQFCRFDKCIVIGMEKKWVMTEEERTNLNKQRKEKKKGIVSPIEPAKTSINKPTEEKYDPDINDMLKYMTVEERDEIESVVQKYQDSYREMPFTASKAQENRNPVEIIGMFTTILRRFAYFAKLLPEFVNLTVDDQSTLLRGGVLEMCLLRSALAFDLQNNRWPKTDAADFLKDCPQLKVEDMERLVSKELLQMHMKFINGIQELKADEPVVMILLLIVLFYPERGNVQDPGYVSEVQEKYVILLNKYTQWRYGPTSSKAFPKLLTKLADLRELNDFHTEYNLKMSRKEVDTIQEQLGEINLNPYPQWVLVQDQRAGRGPAQSKAMRDAMMRMAPGGLMGGGPGRIPSTRDLFMNFVNNKIPALIENPFVPIDMAGEMANMASAAMGIGTGMQQQQQKQFPPHSSGLNEILNFENSFPQEQTRISAMFQGQNPAQLMEQFADRNDGGMPNMLNHAFFTGATANLGSGHTNAFYGQNFMATGQQQSFSDHKQQGQGI